MKHEVESHHHELYVCITGRPVIQEWAETRNTQYLDWTMSCSCYDKGIFIGEITRPQ